MIADPFNDERSRRAETLAFDAERAERRGDHETARRQYAEAADLDLQLALRIVGLPQTRSVFAIEAVCLFARAGRYDLAIHAAQRLLAEQAELSPEGVNDLTDLLSRHRSIVAPLSWNNTFHSPVRNFLFDVRDSIRNAARQEAAMKLENQPKKTQRKTSRKKKS